MAKSYNKSILSKLKIKASFILFLVVFFIEFIAGVYFSYFKGILLNDAFSRTANAFYVLYVKPVRLASIGFVWNPLPSILQLPFVALSKLWRPIVSSGISAVIMTSTSAALTVLLLLKIFTEFNIQKKYSILIIILYITNPFIFFYGMNGMSEEPFFLIIIYITANMCLWIKKGTPEYIIKISFALSLAFLCRYEAIPFSAAIGIGVLINIFSNEKEKKFIPNNFKNEKYYYAEGTAVVLYAPILYTILIWIFLNWTITGNPLYFLNSVYSNSTQSQFTKPTGSFLETILYILKRSISFLPPFFAVIINRLLTKRLLKSDFFILFTLITSMIIFHFLMLIKGSSYGWLRFFSYSLPICIAWLPYELSELKETLQPLFFNIICVSLIISSILTGAALSSPVIAIEEHYVVVSQQSTQISEYINEELSDDKIMMDSFLTSAIILNIKNTDNIIVSSHLNFNKYLNNPAKYGIKYIIVPDPNNGLGILDSFNKKYPSLYKHGSDWCTLKKEFEQYKIFQVID